MFSSPSTSPITSPVQCSFGSSGLSRRAPGTFDVRWTLEERGLNTEYESSKVELSSGGSYTLAAGLEVWVNGTWLAVPGADLVARDKIKVRATSLNEYYAVGPHETGKRVLALTIAGTACLFTLQNMVDPATLNNEFPYTFPFDLG